VGKALDGSDLGPNIDQIPSGKYRLRVLVRDQRMTETASSLPYLQEIRRRIKLEVERAASGSITEATYRELRTAAGSLNVPAALELAARGGKDFVDSLTLWLTQQPKLLLEDLDQVFGEVDPFTAFVAGVLTGAAVVT
jgi:hypothetical protein